MLGRPAANASAAPHAASNILTHSAHVCACVWRRVRVLSWRVAVGPLWLVDERCSVANMCVPLSHLSEKRSHAHTHAFAPFAIARSLRGSHPTQFVRACSRLRHISTATEHAVRTHKHARIHATRSATPHARVRLQFMCAHSCVRQCALFCARTHTYTYIHM